MSARHSEMRIYSAVVIAVGLQGAALLLLTQGADTPPAHALGAAACLCLAALLWQLGLSRARGHNLLGIGRWLIPFGFLVAGAAVLYGSHKSESPIGSLGLTGVAAMLIGAGQLLAEWRRTASPTVGVSLCAGCAVVFVVALLAFVFEGTGRGVALGSAIVAAAALVLVAPIGLTLVSETVLRYRADKKNPVPPRGLAWLLRRWNPLWAVPLLVAVALAGVGLVWFYEFAPGVAIGLVVAVLLLVLAIASNSQADVLLILLVLGVLTIATTADEADNPPPPRMGSQTLVAIGDSYIAGEGAPKFFKGTNEAGENGCRRAPTAYPARVVDERMAGEMTQLAFFACSGARTHNVIGVEGQFDEAPQIEQLRDFVEQHGKPGLVVVSIGGNDAGFATIAQACIAPGNCAQRGQVWLDGLPAVARKNADVYEEIRDVLDDENVPVVAVPYPEPMSEEECAYWHPLPDERKLLNGFAAQLDGAVKWAAGTARVHYLDRMAFVLRDAGLRLCDSDELTDGINAITLNTIRGAADQVLQPFTWTHNSLHPNDRGHREMAKVLDDWIENPGDVPAVPEGPFAPASMDEVMGYEVDHCRDKNTRPCDRGDQLWAVTQVAYVMLKASPLLILIVAGSWLFALIVLEWTRPCLHWLGKRIGGVLFGS